jgi:hypothetical protein
MLAIGLIVVTLVIFVYAVIIIAIAPRREGAQPITPQVVDVEYTFPNHAAIPRKYHVRPVDCSCETCENARND